MSDTRKPAAAPSVWEVGALCRAIAGALDARFNPVAVRGELSGFSRAASGHCYFSIKDAAGQLRCAMFRRAAALLDFTPQDGAVVELRGRLSVYEARGELQLVVESMQRAGAGALFEQFLQLKARLEAEGLFDVARKRALPQMPRAIGVVTSLGAAALHDVLSALRRRAPQVSIVVAPARVQGAGAAAELRDALERVQQPGLLPDGTIVDLVLLVRGGGSIEDLWAFNDERLARAIVASPQPVIAGVGHETDFTIADFCADLRAPTPTAAAELAIRPQEQWLVELDRAEQRLRQALTHELDRRAQRLDRAVQRLGRPSAIAHAQALRLARQQQRLAVATAGALERARRRAESMRQRMHTVRQIGLTEPRARLERAERGLLLLGPQSVLRRGYAWLADAADGAPIGHVHQLARGRHVTATLADGTAGLIVERAGPLPKNN